MSNSQVDIVLIEDDPDDVELALHALQTHHVTNRIEVLRDGESALDYFFRRGAFSDRGTDTDPCVILLDLKLPKVDGLEVLRQLKADAHLKTLPIVVLTSSREENDVVASYKLGANSYIVKPVDFDRFSEAIREVGLYWLLINLPPTKV